MALKSIGNVVGNSESKGQFNPELSDVNFVIPSRQNLMDKSESVKSLMPGLIPETISNLSSVMRGRVTKLTIDGKKSARGRGKTMGDVDCWGFEAGPTLNQQKSRLMDDLTAVETLFSKFDMLNNRSKTKFEEISTSRDTYTSVKSIIQHMGCRLRSTREKN